MDIRRPRRAVRTYVQHLAAPPWAVFPLLCPVREAEWVPGWDPPLVISASGLAEPDCVFTTEGDPGPAVWYVTRHEPAAGFVEMIKVTPGVTACRLTIRLRAAALGTDAEVTYMHTSLGPEGDAFVEGFTEDHYRRFMKEWEDRLNDHLRKSSPADGEREGLQARLEELNCEIRAYPQPIARCDAQLGGLVEERDRIRARLAALDRG